MSSSQRKYIEDVCKSGLQSSSEIPNVRSLVSSFRVIDRIVQTYLL
jgi:hypothetical protein